MLIKETIRVRDTTNLHLIYGTDNDGDVIQLRRVAPGTDPAAEEHSDDWNVIAFAIRMTAASGHKPGWYIMAPDTSPISGPHPYKETAVAHMRHAAYMFQARRARTLTFDMHPALIMSPRLYMIHIGVDRLKLIETAPGIDIRGIRVASLADFVGPVSFQHAEATRIPDQRFGWHLELAGGRRFDVPRRTNAVAVLRTRATTMPSADHHFR